MKSINGSKKLMVSGNKSPEAEVLLKAMIVGTKVTAAIPAANKELPANLTKQWSL